MLKGKFIAIQAYLKKHDWYFLVIVSCHNPFLSRVQRYFPKVHSCYHFSWCHTKHYLTIAIKGQANFHSAINAVPSLAHHHFNSSVISDSLQPHGVQDVSFPCLSWNPGVCSNSCPLSQWCHPTISSSVVPFSSYLQSFPASESFQMSQFFISGGQSIGTSTSTSVLPMNIQDWFPLGLTGGISLQSKGLSRAFSNTAIQKHQFFGASILYGPTLRSICDYWKKHSFD